jgi:hypothetical protein
MIRHRGFRTMAKKIRKVLVYSDASTEFRIPLRIEVDNFGEWLTPDQIDYLRAAREFFYAGTNAVPWRILRQHSASFEMPAHRGTSIHSDTRLVLA